MFKIYKRNYKYSSSYPTSVELYEYVQKSWGSKTSVYSKSHTIPSYSISSEYYVQFILFEKELYVYFNDNLLKKFDMTYILES